MENYEEFKLYRDLSLFGMNKYQSEFLTSDKYKQMSEYLKTCSLKRFYSPYISFSEAKELTDKLVHSYSDTIDLKVYHIPNKSKLYEMFFDHPYEEDMQEILDYVDKIVETRTVTDMPVKIEKNSFRKCPKISLCWDYIYGNFPNIEFFSKLPIIYSNINASKLIEQDMISDYIYTLYSMLASRNKGYTDNLLYDEVIPLFMGMILQLDIYPELERQTIINNLIYLKAYVQENNVFKTDDINMRQITYQKYIVSTLISMQLLDIYMSNKSLQSEIIKDINSILSGDISLENGLLTKYGLSEECGLDTIVSYQKKLKMGQ